MRKQTHEIGQLAEWCCLLRLWLTGWRILARRWKHSSGEIDLIAKRGRTIAFIEVKTRRNRAAALQAVTPRQQQRITRAAQNWLQIWPEYAGFCLRFDIMWVAKWPWPGHLPHAWPAEE